jgi:hypothetical protein
MSEGKRKIVGIGRSEMVKAMEELAKLQAEGKIKVEPSRPRREELPLPEIKKIEPEEEKPFRPDRRNKGHRPIF